MRSVDIRVVNVFPRHRHAQGTQRMEDTKSALVGGKDVGQPPVDMGALVSAAAAKLDALPPEPLHHHLAADQPAASRPAPAPAATGPAAFSRGLRAAHDASRPVDGASQGGARLGAVHTLDDHADVSHGAAK